jgi:hypothetical protein
LGSGFVHIKLFLPVNYRVGKSKKAQRKQFFPQKIQFYGQKLVICCALIEEIFIILASLLLIVDSRCHLWCKLICLPLCRPLLLLVNILSARPPMICSPVLCL